MVPTLSLLLQAEESDSDEMQHDFGRDEVRTVHVLHLTDYYPQHKPLSIPPQRDDKLEEEVEEEEEGEEEEEEDEYDEDMFDEDLDLQQRYMSESWWLLGPPPTSLPLTLPLPPPSPSAVTRRILVGTLASQMRTKLSWSVFGSTLDRTICRGQLQAQCGPQTD